MAEIEEGEFQVVFGDKQVEDGVSELDGVEVGLQAMADQFSHVDAEDEHHEDSVGNLFVNETDHEEHR